MKASVIVPIGLRFDDLDQLCQNLRRVLEPLAPGYEVIFVDDANGPNTQKQVRETAGRFPEARVLRLQRRMGDAAALAVAAQAARGDVLITLDAYQHVPLEELPKLIAPLKQGMDLVCAWRYPRQERGLSRLASDAFNAAARWLTNADVHDLNCRVRVLRREVVADIPIYGDLHRFLPIFAGRRGWRWCEVKVPQLPGKREVGAFLPQSYVGRLLDLLTLAFLTRFVKRPLHFFGLVGASALASGLALSAYLSYVKLIQQQGIGHRPLLLLAVLLIVIGVQIASIGLLGELIIFTHARDLKDYVVKETLE
jgi:glycosyltransferase involved in cell wall biosynthesis